LILGAGTSPAPYLEAWEHAGRDLAAARLAALLPAVALREPIAEVEKWLSGLPAAAEAAQVDAIVCVQEADADLQDVIGAVAALDEAHARRHERIY